MVAAASIKKIRPAPPVGRIADPNPLEVGGLDTPGDPADVTDRVHSDSHFAVADERRPCAEKGRAGTVTVREHIPVGVWPGVAPAAAFPGM